VLETLLPGKGVDLKNKTVLISGGAGGIGRAIEERFLKEGAIVLLCDVNKVGCAP